MARLILVLGTPGVGKSSVGRALARRLHYDHLDISRIVEHEHLDKGMDRERDTLIADPQRLKRHLKIEFEKEKPKGFVISTHYLDSFIPSRMVDVAFVLRLNPEILYKRLSQRGWSREKVAENVESELVGVCLSEALDLYGSRRVIEIDSTNRTSPSILSEMTRIAGSKGKVKGRIGVVDWLESFEPEEWRRRKVLERSRIEYRIVSCPNCKQLLIADTGYKSKSCFHCRRRFELDERPVLGSAKNAREAREILSKMKMPPQTKDDIAVNRQR